MREYYVIRSKYKTNCNKWENCLTYSPDVSLAKSTTGTYIYYHKGKKVWEINGTNEAFNQCRYDYIEYETAKEKFDVIARYSKDCQKFAREEFDGFFKDSILTFKPLK